MVKNSKKNVFLKKKKFKPIKNIVSGIKQSDFVEVN